MSYTIEDVDFAKDWDYSLPTLEVSASLTSLRKRRARSVEEFAARFYASYDTYFSQLETENILFAGGAVMSSLLAYDWHNDVDLFLYALNESEANKKVEEIMTQIFDSYAIAYLNTDEKLTLNEAQKYMQETITTIRNDNCVTLRFHDEQEIQIILRLYSSVKEILDGFDLGSCAAGYDGEQLFFSERGLWSYENLANVVEPSKRSTTYEYRLVKYWARGFRIVLPELDIEKLSLRNLKYGVAEIAALPYLPFSYVAVKGNKIKAQAFLRAFTCKSDYDEGLQYYEIRYLNLRRLVKKEKTGFYFSAQGPNYDVLYDVPYLDNSWLEQFYDSLEVKIRTQKIALKSLLRYLEEDIFLEVLKRSDEEDCPQVTDLIQEQKKRVFAAKAALPEMGLFWRTNDPGSQINGSYNPILSDAKDWYGEYLA